MRYHLGGHEPQTLWKLYSEMLLSRLIEEKMLVLLRQGKISKWFSGIGQEAIAIGITTALKDEEYILPMHRNLGVFTARNIPLHQLFSQWQGKPSGFTQGRDRSFHFGTKEHHIVGMISHLGPQLGVACGIALASILDHKQTVTAVFTGEGATSEGDFHEALNLASVWKLPVIFCIENNGYGLSTPTSEQYACAHLADRAKGYGMESRILEGNNILEVYDKIKEIASSLRKAPRPILVEFKTFRIRGHEEASGTKYVPDELIKQWEEKDPLNNFEAFLKENSLFKESDFEQIKTELKSKIDAHLGLAFEAPFPVPDIQKEKNEVYAHHNYKLATRAAETKNIRFVDAIKDGLYEAMKTHDDLILMGQDIAEYGGVFKVTEGFVQEFGKNRVRNTPICESIVVSAAMGLNIAGKKAMVEMQFADFVSSGFNPIVNLLAKSYYRWKQEAPTVIRMPCGGGVGAGPFHSQTNEIWFLKTPGIKVVYPAFPDDAKGLLIAAIEDPNPVLFFEHKGLYRSVYGEVPTGYYQTPLGVANLIKEGTKVTLVTYGSGVHWALELLQDDRYRGVVDLIDLRCLNPLDFETIELSIRKTGKLLILHEDSYFCGLGAEIAAHVTEHCFKHLDAPIKRVGSLDTPIPFASALEEQYLAKHRLKYSLNELLAY